MSEWPFLPRPWQLAFAPPLCSPASAGASAVYTFGCLGFGFGLTLGFALCLKALTSPRTVTLAWMH